MTKLSKNLKKFTPYTIKINFIGTGINKIQPTPFLKQLDLSNIFFLKTVNSNN